METRCYIGSYSIAFRVPYVIIFVKESQNGFLVADIIMFEEGKAKLSIKPRLFKYKEAISLERFILDFNEKLKFGLKQANVYAIICLLKDKIPQILDRIGSSKNDDIKKVIEYYKSVKRIETDDPTTIWQNALNYIAN